MTEKIEKVKEALKKLGYKKGTKIRIMKRPFDCVDVWANNEYL